MTTTTTTTPARYHGPILAREHGPLTRPESARLAALSAVRRDSRDWLAHRRAERPILAALPPARESVGTAAATTAAERSAAAMLATARQRDAWLARTGGPITPAELLRRCRAALATVPASATERDDALGELAEVALRRAAGWSAERTASDRTAARLAALGGTVAEPLRTVGPDGRPTLTAGWLAQRAAWIVAHGRSAAESQRTASLDALTAEREQEASDGQPLGPWAAALSRADRAELLPDRETATVGAWELAHRLGATRTAERTAILAALLARHGRDGRAVAAALGCSPAALRKRQHDGAEQLRDRYPTPAELADAVRAELAGREHDRYRLAGAERAAADAVDAVRLAEYALPRRATTAPARVALGGAVMAGTLTRTGQPSGRLTTTPAERRAAERCAAERRTAERQRAEQRAAWDAEHAKWDRVRAERLGTGGNA